MCVTRLWPFEEEEGDVTTLLFLGVIIHADWPGGLHAGGPGSRSSSLDIARGRSSLDIARGRSRRNSSAGFLRAATEPPTIIEGQPLQLPQKGSAEDSTTGMLLSFSFHMFREFVSMLEL